MKSIHQQWAHRAAELARWVWSRMVNRTDVWGGYHAIADRAKMIKRADGAIGPLGATTTRPAKSRRGQLSLTIGILEQHFQTAFPQHIVGLHTTSPANACRWGAVEVDHHGEGSTPADINLTAALAWYERLRKSGFHPLLTDSNG